MDKLFNVHSQNQLTGERLTQCLVGLVTSAARQRRLGRRHARSTAVFFGMAYRLVYRRHALLRVLLLMPLSYLMIISP